MTIVSRERYLAIYVCWLIKFGLEHSVACSGYIAPVVRCTNRLQLMTRLSSQLTTGRDEDLQIFIKVHTKI